MLGFSITNSSLTQYYLSLCNKLAETHRVVVVTDKEEPHPFPLSPKITIRRWPSVRPVHFRDFVFLVKLVLRYRPRVIISMFGSMNLFTVVGFLLGVRHRIAWNHSIYQKSGASRRKDSRKALIYSMSTVVFANSKATAADTISHFSVPASKIRVCYNAVSDDPLHAESRGAHFLFVGRLHVSKGFDLLLEAMTIVIKKVPDARLEVMGGWAGGRAIEHYREMAAALGVGKNVVFLGNRTRQEVAEVYRGAAFTVVPSFLEAFGLVVIESYASGTPVVGSRTTGIAELVRDGRDGLLFEPGNAGELAGCIVTLLGDRPLRERMGAAAKEHFLEAFELEKVTSEIAALLAAY